ncbi:MAG: hypothetical protein LPH21_16185, partial [Shewanella sp.]|nr:hypothetical protein [Shewanella sp.]
LTEPLTDGTLTIHAKAAKFKGSYKAPRDATFDDITLGQLVQQMADAHNYEAAVSPALAAVHYPHIDQVGESDMALLTRLAREQGAMAKPVANRLVVVPHDEAKTVSGKPLPPVEIGDPANSGGQVTITERSDYQAVVAHWFDEPAQQKVKERAGSGEPCYTLRQTYPSQAEAQAAAHAKLSALQRGKASLSLNRPLTPQIVAGGQVSLSNHRASANGVWLVEEVQHVIESGSVAYTSLSGVIPPK